MGNPYKSNQVTEEDRRDFLKALGISGATAAGSITLSEARDVLGSSSTEELATIGQAIQADLSESLNAEQLANKQAAFAAEASALPAVIESGVPEVEQRNDFAPVAEAGQPIFEQLSNAGFFESTTQHLPEITPEYLETTIKSFVGSSTLTEYLSDIGLSDEAGADLVATVVANAEQLSTHHWVATDEIPREAIEYGELIPPMTQAAAEGVLLWLQDLDQHLWQKQVLLDEERLQDAVWHGHSMSVGFHLMTEGARQIAAESGELSNGDLGALLSTGFAVQAISQNLLAQDAYWITEEMRAQKSHDVKVLPRD